MIVQQFLDGLARNAAELFLIVALVTFLLALFIAGMGVFRFLEWAFPPFARWLDRNLEPSIWDEQ